MSLFSFSVVAGSGIEPLSQGYEPCEIPLLYPAINVNQKLERFRIVAHNLGYSLLDVLLEIHLLYLAI